MHRTILLVALIMAASTLWAQKLEEASVLYKVKHVEGANLDDPSIVEAINSMGMRISVKGDYYRVDVLGLQEMSFIMDYTSNTIHTLIDMGGRKLAVKSTIEDFQDQIDKAPPYEFTTSKETTTILKYKCNKALIKKQDGTKLNLYYSKKVRFANKKFIRQYKEVDGLAIEFDQADQVGTLYTYTLAGIQEKDIKDELFQIPAGYEVMTQKELEDLMMGQN